MPQMLMAHEIDPARLILDTIGDLDDFEIFGNFVLLGVYERPNVTKTGIYIPDQTRGEDKHQGKAGLVLKKGPMAFVSDSNYDFGDSNVEVGDWVSIWVSDGRAIVINKQLCRLVEDQYIRLKIPAPDVVF